MKKRQQKTIKEHERRSKEMNKVWHNFTKQFKEGNDWKYSGFELMEKIERWADKQEKGSVDICGCDDSMFMCSDLVLVHHLWADQKTKKKNCWGTSVVLLTQDGQPPTEFFLYPGHAQGLIDSLSKVWKIRERK